jgi:hypothetical protein
MFYSQSNSLNLYKIITNNIYIFFLNLQAMVYIHNSNIKFHGHLNSMNCVIDSRFVLKVTEFGIQSLRDFSVDLSRKGICTEQKSVSKHK